MHGLRQKRSSAWFHANRELVLQRKRAYYYSEKGQAACKAYAQSERGRQANRRSVKNLALGTKSYWWGIPLSTARRNKKREQYREMDRQYVRNNPSVLRAAITQQGMAGTEGHCSV